MSRYQIAALLLPAALLPGLTSAQADRFTNTKPMGEQLRSIRVQAPRAGAPRWLQVKVDQTNDMSGWTQFTEGAANGGPSAVKIFGGSSFVIVRGADNVLYQVSVNQQSPAKIVDPAAWISLNVEARSEPNCRPVAASSQYGCAWLGPAGNAQYMIIGLNEVREMGGKFTSRPALASLTMKGQNNVITWGVRMTAQAGTHMQRRSLTSDASAGGLVAKEDSGWVDTQSGMPAPVQCDAEMCAWINGGKLGVNNPFDIFPSSPAPTLEAGWSRSAPAPVKLASGKYAVVVRGANGHIYRTITGGLFGPWTPWVDEGGTTMNGSSIACLANGEQPVCFVQSLDGRIYWKKLGTAAGL